LKKDSQMMADKTLEDTATLDAESPVVIDRARLHETSDTRKSAVLATDHLERKEKNAAPTANAVEEKSAAASAKVAADETVSVKDATQAVNPENRATPADASADPETKEDATSVEVEAEVLEMMAGSVFATRRIRGRDMEMRSDDASIVARVLLRTIILTWHCMAFVTSTAFSRYPRGYIFWTRARKDLG
jgi:hypothetical protein